MSEGIISEVYIVESCEQNDYNLAINSEGNDMRDEDMYAEVWEIVSHFNTEERDRIPGKILRLLDLERNRDYVSRIDPPKFIKSGEYPSENHKFPHMADDGLYGKSRRAGRIDSDWQGE